MPEASPAGNPHFRIAAMIATSAVGLGLVGGMALHRSGLASVPHPVDPFVETTPPAMVQLADSFSAEFAVATKSVIASTRSLRRGETLSDLFTDLGASPPEAHRALQALVDADLIDPRRVRPGLSATLTLEPANTEAEPARLVGLSLRTEPDFSLIATALGDGQFGAARLDARLSPAPMRVAGEITTTLYEAALEQGAGDQQVVDFAKIFGYDVDFQRQIYPGDRFEIVYESLVDERGNAVRMGNVIFASLDGGALTRDYYFHVPSDDGISDYFDSDGNAATKFLMKTPINGARLSSSFGMRRHPISGYNRLHKGTDFAAPTGTPVYAAGHGTVERASRNGGYGNYVRIRHANGYETAYAHLSRYGAGIRAGTSVRQGDIIGYVGSTGASTGPHLHYEVHINGRPVNAMELNFPTGRKLADTPEMLDEFLARKQEVDSVRRALGADIEVAGTPSASSRAG